MTHRDWFPRSQRTVSRLRAINDAQQQLALRRMSAAATGQTAALPELDRQFTAGTRRFARLANAHRDWLDRVCPARGA